MIPKNSNNQISFQSIKCYQIPKKTFETFQRRVRKLTQCEAIVIKESPSYDLIEKAVKKAGGNTGWIKENFKKYADIQLPQSIDKSTVKVFVLRGKDKLKYQLQELSNDYFLDIWANCKIKSITKNQEFGSKASKEFLSDYLYFRYFKYRFDKFLQKATFQ